MYSSSLSPAAEATCCSCAGVCFLNIRCRSTKTFADSGDVCSNTAKPPYLWPHVNLLIRNIFKQSVFLRQRCASGGRTRRRGTCSERTSSPEARASEKPRCSQVQRRRYHSGGSTGGPPFLDWGDVDKAELQHESKRKEDNKG